MGRTKEISAGILAFRRVNGLEVLLAHPGGPFWAKKDDGVWTVPKGLVEPGDDLLTTARREFAEETNLIADGAVIALNPVKQKSGKVVHAFAVEADLDLAAFTSNVFEIEWPPKSGRQPAFPGNRPHRLFRDTDRRGKNSCLPKTAVGGPCTSPRMSIFTLATITSARRYSRKIWGQSTSSCGNTQVSRRAASLHSLQAGSAMTASI